METTSPSLLERLRAAGPRHPDWHRLQELYRPLVRRWLARAPDLDPDDLTQEVLATVARELPRFDPRGPGAFRSWLRAILTNRVRTARRAAKRRPQPADPFLMQLDDPASDLSRQWDRDHDRHVADALMAAVRGDFTPPTWDAFTLTVVDGHSTAAAAAATGLTENAVLLAKARVLRRLRDEAAGLLE